MDLGTAAARWADRLSRPRSRLDKLGVRPGARVTVFTVDDPTLVPELGQRASVVYLDIPREPMDVVFFGVTQPSQLHRVGYLRWYLRRDGALWLVRPTGSVKVTEAQVLAAGRGARMVDTRVVSLAPGLTAHRFVFPLTAR